MWPFLKDLYFHMIQYLEFGFKNNILTINN